MVSHDQEREGGSTAKGSAGSPSGHAAASRISCWPQHRTTLTLQVGRTLGLSDLGRGGEMCHQKLGLREDTEAMQTRSLS